MADPLAGLSAALSDRYRIECELGQGGMATVYRAEDLKHHRKVAIKVLKPEIAAAVGAERFLREIETTAGLRHPHILPLYDSGQVELARAGATNDLASTGARPLTLLYYAMPCIEGESLRDRLSREKQLPLDDAIEIARQVADALAFAHGRGILHRDIKPENILLESGHAVVADFGIARAVTAAGEASLTETGISMGTPGYMSPEQFMGDVLDGRSDIYSLGCVLYEMLAGEPPFTGASAQAILAKRLSEPLPQLRTLRESVPKNVDDAVRRALARVPADRFADAAQFRATLQLTPPGPRWVEQPSGPWRLLGLYAIASVAILGAIRIMDLRMELPAWVLPGAGALLLIGLPIVIASMMIQRGTLRPPRGVAWFFTWRRTLLGGALALSGWGVAVTGWLLLGDRAFTGAEDDRTAIAVLPFEVSGLDSTLWKWGAATLVSTNLDGVGSLRRIDSRTIESRWRERTGRGGGDLVRDGISVARGLGARYALTASMLNATGSLRISADLYNARSGSHLGPSVQVTGSADSIPALLDQLSIEVLRRTPLVAGVVSVPQVDIARAITASPAAMKAYLAGDELYRRSRWQQAIEQFNRATELDSTFALAWYRLSLAHGWMFNDGERLEYARRALRFSARLPEREQILLRGLEELASGNTRSVDTFAEYTRRYPDDVEGWTLLGHARYVYGGLRLEPLDEFRAAYERSVELGPYFGPAYLHLIADGFQRGDSAALRRLLAGYRNIDSLSDWCVGNELAFALAFGDSAQQRWATSALDTLGAAPSQPVGCTAFDLVTTPDYHKPLQIVLRSMARPQRPPDARAWGEWINIGDLLGRGQIREARRMLDAKMKPEEGIYPLALHIMMHVTHYADTAAVRRLRRALQESPGRQAPFWAGVLAIEAGREDDVRQAVQQLRTRARSLALNGDSLGSAGNMTSARALELYADLRRAPAEAAAREILALLPGLGLGADVYSSRLLRYEVGRVLLFLDQPAVAQRIFDSFGVEELTGEYITPVEYYRGRAAEDLGSPDARLRYQRFLRWWENADPELQALRDDARERLARLVAEPTAKK